MNYKHSSATIILSLLFTIAYAQEKVNLILIGTVHFNNPGFDRGKVIDINILSEAKQGELEEITSKISQKYHPDKIFVESPYADRQTLSHEYDLYRRGKPYYKDDSLATDFLKKKYAQNEIYQLGFRLARKAKNEAIYSMDHDLEQRYDLLEGELRKSIDIDTSHYMRRLSQLTLYINKSLERPKLREILSSLNSPEQMLLNKGTYISVINRLNTDPEFFGPDFLSSWYKRNLIMYSHIQNQVNQGDKNIVVIVGCGHAAMFYDFIINDERFNLITFDEATR